MVNPMIVEGQVHGGLAQGIGQALLEAVVYDEGGQPLTGSYMDYTMPRAANVPSFEVVTSAGTVHRQLAGREGLRRGRGDRLAAGGDQRDHQRHRGAGRDAGDAGEGLARDPGAPGCPSGRGEGRGDGHHVQLQLPPAASVAEAVALLGAHGDAKLMAGGQTFIPTLKQRLAQPSDLIDLGGIAELKGIKEEAGGSPSGP